MLNNSGVDKAERLYKEQSDFWAAELIGELENRLSGVAFQWAMDCFDHFFVAVPERYAYLQKMLTELAQESVTTEALMAKAQAIEQDRDDKVRLALAHLFMAKICLLTHDHHYRYHLVHAMCFLGAEDSFRQSALDFALRQARELLRK